MHTWGGADGPVPFCRRSSTTTEQGRDGRSEFWPTLVTLGPFAAVRASSGCASVRVEPLRDRDVAPRHRNKRARAKPPSFSGIARIARVGRFGLLWRASLPGERLAPPTEAVVKRKQRVPPLKHTPLP